jgi:hypothetical protein
MQNRLKLISRGIVWFDHYDRMPLRACAAAGARATRRHVPAREAAARCVPARARRRTCSVCTAH